MIGFGISSYQPSSNNMFYYCCLRNSQKFWQNAHKLSYTIYYEFCFLIISNFISFVIDFDKCDAVRSFESLSRSSFRFTIANVLTSLSDNTLLQCILKRGKFNNGSYFSFSQSRMWLGRKIGLTIGTLMILIAFDFAGLQEIFATIFFTTEIGELYSIHARPVKLY